MEEAANNVMKIAIAMEKKNIHVAVFLQIVL